MTDKNRRTALDSAALVAEPGTPAAEVIETAEAFLRWLEPPAVKPKPRAQDTTTVLAADLWRQATRPRGAAKTAESAWTARYGPVGVLAFDETHLFKPGASFEEWIWQGPPFTAAKPTTTYRFTRGGVVKNPPERIIPLRPTQRDPETGADVAPTKYVYFRGRGRLYRVVSGDGEDAPAEYWYGPSRQWASAAIWSKYSDLRDSSQFARVSF